MVCCASTSIIVAAEKSLPAKNERQIRVTGPIVQGFFSKAAPNSRNKQHQKDLASTLQEILLIFLDDKTPLFKKAEIAKQILDYTKWKFSKDSS